MEDFTGMGYTPQFNVVQPQMQASQPVYPVFSAPQYPMDVYNGAFMPYQNAAAPNLAEISITPANNGQPVSRESVPLYMSGLVYQNDQEVMQRNANASRPAFNNLVYPDPVVPEEPVYTENPQFSDLVAPQDPSKIQQKFALQPLPDGVDRSMLPKPNLFQSAINQVNAHLSKNNQPNQEIGRKVNNWFTRLLDQRGQDYISSGKLTIDEVSRNAERILDDMISGKIDYNRQGSLIIQPIIIETLINYCANKLAINRAIQSALGYLYNDYTNRMSISVSDQERLSTLAMIDDAQSRNITQAIAIVNQDIAIYEILHQKLLFVNATKNASSLFSLTNDLNNYKKQMKKRY